MYRYLAVVLYSVHTYYYKQMQRKHPRVRQPEGTLPKSQGSHSEGTAELTAFCRMSCLRRVDGAARLKMEGSRDLDGWPSPPPAGVAFRPSRGRHLGRTRPRPPGFVSTMVGR